MTHKYTQKKEEISDEPTKSQPSPQLFAINFFV